jgi:hypothetical protein
MALSGKASPGAKWDRDSSDQPLCDAQAQPTTSVQQLVKKAKSESTFKEETDPFNEAFVNDANRPDSPFVVKLQASAALTDSSASPTRTSSLIARPSTRGRIVRIRRDRSASKPKSPVPERSNPVRDRIVQKVAEIAAENVRKEKEEEKQKGNPQSSSQDVDRAAANSWKEKFLATEKEKEKLQSKPNKGKSQDKEKKPGRPRSQTIRRTNSDADEAEDWEKDYADLTGSFFEEPKEWLIAQGLTPASGPPPSPRPRPYNAENDNGDWDVPASNMNNSYNFDPNMNPNAARQAPNAAQAQQMNGMNNGQHWPNVGAQADMNVLWEYIQNLSQMHEGIRAQTQHVLNGVQQIHTRGTGDGDAAPHVNGVSNGIFTPLPS